MKLDPHRIKKYIEYSKFTVEKHPKANLYIYGYDNRKPGERIIWDDFNINLRGLILNSRGLVIQRSFIKFFTFKSYITRNRVLLTEGQSLKLPECKFRIFEKVDGSMAILYWVKNRPFLASQRSFCSPNAIKATEILYKYYSHTFDKLRKDVTYIFEAIYPNTRVLVNYNDGEKLVLLGIIDNESGKELPLEHIGFPTAKDLTKKYGETVDLEQLTNLNIKNMEGFVLQYENGLRIKLKFPWFNEAHRIVNQLIYHSRHIYEYKKKLNNLLNLNLRNISNFEIWKLLKDGKNVETILINIPEDFYTLGFEIWFNETVGALRENYLRIVQANPSMSLNEAWNSVKPKKVLYFDPDARKKLPMHATPMWNLFERLKNNYL